MIRPWNLGPTVMDFSPLGNLGQNFLGSYQQASKIGLENRRQSALAELGAGGGPVDPRALGQKLLGLGDLEGSLAAIRLAEVQDDRNLNRTRLNFVMETKRRELEGRQQAAGLLSGQGGRTQTAGGSAPSMKTADPVSQNLLPHERGFLNAVSAGESAGDYNVRYTPRGGATFQNTGQHPGIREPGPHGPSTAAGRYQFTKTTWDSLPPEAKGDGTFSPENQDRAALYLARRDYRARTNRDLDADLQQEGFSPRIQQALAPTWQALKGNNDRWAKAYVSSLDRNAGAAAPQAQAQAQAQGAPYVPPGVSSAQLRQEAQALAQSNPEAARQMVAQADELDRRQAPQPSPGQNFTPRPGMTPRPGVASAPDGTQIVQANAGAPPPQQAAIPGAVPSQPQPQQAQRVQQPIGPMPGDPRPDLTDQQLFDAASHPFQDPQTAQAARDLLSKRAQYRQAEATKRESWDREQRLEAQRIEAENRKEAARQKAEDERAARLANQPTERKRRAVEAGLQPGTPEYQAFILDTPADKPPERVRLAREAGLQPGSPEWKEYVLNGSRQNMTAAIDERNAIADRLGLQGEDRKLFLANGKLPTAGEKALTEGQGNAAMYADRMLNAHAILSDPKSVVAMMSPQQKVMEAIPTLGNYGMTTEGQKAVQAQRDFVNAILRKESGAAIGASEFENARKQYFPQPGDGSEVIRQKQINRETAIAGLKRAAGPAYGKAQQPQATPSQAGQPNRTKSGVAWSIEP